MTNRNKPTPIKSGYAVSRYNATKHGIFSATALMPWENAEDYDALHAEYAAHYAPIGPSETRLVRILADLDWRERRVQSAEGGALREALRKAVRDQLNAGRSDSGLAESVLFRLDGSDQDDLFAVVMLPRETAITELRHVEEDLAAISTGHGILNDTRDAEKAISVLPETVCDAYAAALRNHGIEPGDGAVPDEGDEEIRDDCVSQRSIRFASLDFVLSARKTKLVRKKDVLTHYQEIHEAAHLDVYAGTQYQNKARAERDIDGKFKETLSLLLQLQKYRKCAVSLDRGKAA